MRDENLDSPSAKGPESKDPLQHLKNVWNDLQIDQWDDAGGRGSDNDKFWDK